MTTTNVHPYFIAKAREVFGRAKGNPDLSADLAAWAEKAHEIGDSRWGCIVTAAGQVVAETHYVPYTMDQSGVTYVTWVIPELTDVPNVYGKEVTIGIINIRQHMQCQAIHVRYSEACQGAGKFIKEF